MKTKLSSLLLTVILMVAGAKTLNAQVTIGSDNEPKPFSTLQIDGNTGGLRLPLVDTLQRDALKAKLGSDPESVGLLIYYTTHNVAQYWDGTKWVEAKGNTHPWLVCGSTDLATLNTENIYQMGSVTIGHNTTDSSAILNLQSTNKGVLLPRVALTSSTDKITIPKPTTGLLVYNTGANPAFSTTGYMFWDGTQWRVFANASAESAAATLNCAGAQMTPAQQIVGDTPIMAGTIIQIPYTGSNGGSFNGITLTSVGNPDVTATIASGMLSVGNGVLNFALSGTPTLGQQAPTGITFDLTPFLDANTGITGCDEITVGNVLSASIIETAVMGYFMFTTDDTGNDQGAQHYALQCNSPDGKYSIRAQVPASRTSVAHGNQYLNIQVRNNQSFATPVIWNFNTDYGAALSSSGVLTIPPQRWGGDRETGRTWTNNGDAANVYWGQIGIYDAAHSGPEYRRYTWIPQGPDNKVCYEATIMVALDTTTPTTAVHPTRIKCYIKFSQVTAQ